MSERRFRFGSWVLAALAVSVGSARGQQFPRPCYEGSLRKLDLYIQDEFGSTLAMGPDQLIVGAFHDDEVAQGSGAVLIYDAASHELLRKIKADPPVGDGQFGRILSRAGDLLAVSAFRINSFYATSVYLVDLKTGNQLFRLQSPSPLPYGGFGSSIALAPPYLAVAAPGEAAVYVFNTSDGSLHYRLHETTNDGFENPTIYSLAADGPDMVLRRPWGLEVWDLAAGNLRHRLVANDGATFFSMLRFQNGRVLTRGYLKDRLVVFDAATGAQLFEVPKGDGMADATMRGDVLAVGFTGDDSRVELWDLPSATRLYQLHPPDLGLPGKFHDPASYGKHLALDREHLLVTQGPMFIDRVHIYDVAGVAAEVYCSPAVANSTGGPASLSAEGCSSIMANDLTLRAEALPPGVLGMVLVSADAALLPFHGGGQGTLCLGAPLGRFEPHLTTTAGELRQAVDLSQLPTGAGPVQVQPGETWRFQVWYRDSNPAPTSNLSDALSIEFR
jgi:FG-GAP repeat